MSFGIDYLTECIADLPEGVFTTVHACCGFPNYLVSIEPNTRTFQKKMLIRNSDSQVVKNLRNSIMFFCIVACFLYHITLEAETFAQ